MGTVKPRGLSRRAYAKARGVDEKAVRLHIESGLLKPAILPDGSLNAGLADVLLSTGTVKGPASAPDLADARRRKLAAQVALLQDEIAERRASLVTIVDRDKLVRTMVLEVARRSAAIVKHAGKAAGLPVVEAASVMTDRVHELLTELSTQPFEAEQEAKRQDRGARNFNVPNLNVEPSVSALADMSTTELAARKADLEAERLEILRDVQNGVVEEVDEALLGLTRRLLDFRSALLAMPTRVAPVLQFSKAAAARQEVAKILRECVGNLAGPDTTEAELLEALDG